MYIHTYAAYVKMKSEQELKKKNILTKIEIISFKCTFAIQNHSQPLKSYKTLGIS